MKTKSKVLIAGLFVLLFGLNACRNKDPEPYRPKPADASFVIKDNLRFTYPWGRLFDFIDVEDSLEYFKISDTTGGFAVFEALDTNMIYEWKIGNDDRTFRTKRVSLSFPTIYPDEGFRSYPVRLIATSKDSALLPPHLQKDTMERVLTNISVDNLAWIGRFEGETTQYPGEKSVFELGVTPNPYFPGELAVKVISLPDKADYSNVHYRDYGILYRTFDIVSIGYRVLIIDFPNVASSYHKLGIFSPRFFIYVKPGGKTIRVEYEVMTDTINSTFTHYSFRGTKVY